MWQVAIVSSKGITSVHALTNVQGLLYAIKELFRHSCASFIRYKTKAPLFRYIAIYSLNRIIANKLIAALKRRKVVGSHGKKSRREGSRLVKPIYAQGGP